MEALAPETRLTPGSMRPARVVLIGPESTGKTWLARDLAMHYGVPWAAEHARDYVAGLARALTPADVDAIGRGQEEAEDAAITRAEAVGSSLVVLDTDLVSTMVYSRHHYGSCPRWIEEAAARRLADLYLLHHVDVGWQPDGLQRAQPERRAELFERFGRTLLDLRAPTADISGPWNERWRKAVAAVDSLLAALL